LLPRLHCLQRITGSAVGGRHGHDSLLAGILGRIALPDPLVNLGRLKLSEQANCVGGQALPLDRLETVLGLRYLASPMFASPRSVFC